jgi:hypothetical protein
MKYSKHFEHDGIIIIFDKLVKTKEYPLLYAAMRNGNTKASVFIPMRKFKKIREVETETIKIVTFGFYEENYNSYIEQ